MQALHFVVTEKSNHKKNQYLHSPNKNALRIKYIK